MHQIADSPQLFPIRVLSSLASLNRLREDTYVTFERIQSSCGGYLNFSK